LPKLTIACDFIPHSAHRNRKLVGSTLVFRDRTTAHCQLAAFDVERKQSAVFQHWHAMADMHLLGARRYSLGPATRLARAIQAAVLRTSGELPGSADGYFEGRVVSPTVEGGLSLSEAPEANPRRIVSHVKS
jgi:hypothetical protein